MHKLRGKFRSEHLKLVMNFILKFPYLGHLATKMRFLISLIIIILS